MGADSHAERYLRLGLQLGRHGDDAVDVYFGPPELKAAADDADPVDPARLAASAEELLGELGDGWLRDQVSGVRAYAEVLAGASRPYADEVEACYLPPPKRTDEAVFTEVHERLEELLPGPGALAERDDAFRTASLVPGERVGHVTGDVIETARRCTRELVDLPDGCSCVSGEASAITQTPRRSPTSDPNPHQQPDVQARRGVESII